MAPAPDRSPSTPDAGQRSILVIEDNADARAALVALLELEGWTVEHAADGPEGIEIMRAKSPRVALIDIGLPGMDGYEVARRVRALPQEQPFLVALTGYGQPEDRRRAQDAGFDAHLVKPVDPDDLTAILSRETPGPGSRG
jgi:two-component system, sensor histidine kinase